MPNRDEVFIAGGQPTITYVDREEQHVERSLARAIAMPNQIVSLSGPTKTGKTVLCRRILNARQYVWIDGGKIRDSDAFWASVQGELRFPSEYVSSTGSETSAGGEGGVPFITSANGSRMWAKSKDESFKVDSMARALEIMTNDKIILVIDDFHYIPSDARTEIMRNVKGAVFNGFKIILLSVTHRVFDAIKAETELTGRFTSVSLPAWTKEELRKIPSLGFSALKVDCNSTIIDSLCAESQDNPFLMQKFCWEICFDNNIDVPALFKRSRVQSDYDIEGMYVRLAQDAGVPIYQKLAAGPQSRKVRAKRPLRSGGEVDIYEATLRAIAETGPKTTIKYDEIKTAMSNILIDMVPQKHEVTSALKHLTRISSTKEAESAVDWDEDSREVTIADPYLRFYLRWSVRRGEPD